MKKIFIIFLSLILVSCFANDKNSNKPKERPSVSDEMQNDEKKEDPSQKSDERLLIKDKKDIKYSYDLDDDKAYKKDNSLFVNRMLFTYPSEISAKEEDPYSLDDFKNLDYEKDLYYGLLNFRIPKRAEVFKNSDGLFAIDFPKSSDYNIKIYLKKAFEDNKYEKTDIEKLFYPYIKAFFDSVEEDNKLEIIQEPFKISDPQKDAYYFIANGEKFTHTYLFVKGPNNIIFFDIVEETEKSDLSKYLMADLLTTIYKETEDPINVGKNFYSYKNKIDLFATEKVEFNDLYLKIPKTLKSIEDDDKLKAFSKDYKQDTLSQVLLIRSPKFDKDNKKISLKDAFNETSGSSLAPAYIVPMGEVQKEKINEKDALTSEIRIYIDNSTSQGAKTTIETDEDFLTVIVTGPLSNSNEIRLLNKNILNSLRFK